MSHNTFGHLFRVTTFGESHGVAIGCVVDGCPPGIPLEAAEIQAYLDKRKPGQSRFTTQRREADNVRMLSGVFSDDMTRQQVTTGTPIALLIENTDQRSKDYSDIRDKYRPGHGDFTYDVNTACAIIAAAAELQPARPHAALRQGRSREKCSRM
jgi:chorismate synthase